MRYISEFNIPTDGEATPHLHAAMAQIAPGDTLVLDGEASYEVARLKVPSNITVVASPAITFRKRANSGGLLYLSGNVNTKFYANGAKFDGTDPQGTTALGHNIYALGTTDCLLSGLESDNASPGKDGLYAGLGEKPNEGLKVIGGKYTHAKRNAISVVAATSYLIEGVETAYTDGTGPGAGIDIEANFYDHVCKGVLRKIHSHHNISAGALSIFGTGTTIEDPDIHDNGTYGVGVSSGGYQFSEDRFRPNVDMIGVIGFDMATGAVLLAERPPIGTPVNFSLRNGALRPPEFNTSYYVVSRYIGTHGVILGKSERHSEVTGLSMPGAGVMSADPYESDIRLRAFVKGQSGDVKLRGGKLYNNGAQGLFYAGAGGLRAYDTEIYDNGSNQVQIQYTRDVDLCALKVRGGSKMGVAASGSGGLFRMAHCEFDNVGGRALSLAEWTDAEIEWNSANNCGAMELGSAKAAMHLAACLSPTVHRNKVRQDPSNTTTLFGIYAENSVIGGRYTCNDVTGAGTTGANALKVPPGSFKSENTGRDGVVQP